MNIELTDEQVQLGATARKFLATSTPTSVVRELADLPGGFDREWWKSCADLGWTYMLAGDPDGPTLAGLADLVVVAEEVGRAVAPGPLVPSNLAAWAIATSGSESAKELFLDGLISGELVGSWAFAEGEGSWEAESITTAARRTDSGGVVLDGFKAYVEAGAQADVLLVTARGSDGELVQVLVVPDDSGVSIVESESIDLVRRFATVTLEEVAIPASRVLDASASVADDVTRQFNIAVALLCAEMVGAMDRVFEFTLEWAFDRYSFGRPLASYQALKHRFADMKVWLEACHASATAAAQAVADDTADASEIVSVAKAYIGEHAPELIQDCIQMHGGIGVTWEHDIHLFLRRVVLDRAVYDDPAAHRRRIADFLGV